MPKAIVTGGAGFLGTHLCRALDSAGYEVLVIDVVENAEYETVIADVRDQAAMLELIKDADVVFHLAAFIEVGDSVAHPHKHVENNIVGSLNVLEAMRQNGLKNFIFSSTAAVYGEPEVIPLVEDARTIPISPYGATKLAMEGLISSYCYNFGFTGIALRYFNLYGPEEWHEPETHAIPRFISQISHDKEVTVWGEGEHQRDFIYISDIVDAHLAAVRLTETQPGQYHYFNLSTQKPLSVMEVIQKIADGLGKTPKIKHFPPRAGDPLLLYADASKAKRELGWEAKVSFDEGIEKTIAFFQEHPRDLSA